VALQPGQEGRQGSANVHPHPDAVSRRVQLVLFRELRTIL
jgi:hypothetical protein